MSVGIGYVVLYVEDTVKTAEFWSKAFNFEIKSEQDANGLKVIAIGAKDSQTNFELVPLALMADNPFNLNLGMPSICLHTDDLEAEHQRLSDLGINITDINDHGGRMSFAVIDDAGNGIAMMQR